MALPDVADGAAVRNDIAIKTPLFAQNVSHQSLVRATWFAVRAVVSTHDRLRVTLDDCGSKRGQVGFAQIAFVGPGIEAVTFRFWSTVYRIVLRGRY